MTRLGWLLLMVAMFGIGVTGGGEPAFRWVARTVATLGVLLGA